MRHVLLYNAHTYDRENVKRVQPTGKSLTVPDQVMSLRTLLNRFTTGQPINDIMKEGYGMEFEDDENVYPDVEHMDLVDRAVYFEDIIKNADAAKSANKKALDEQNARRKSKQDEIERAVKFYNESQAKPHKVADPVK